MSEEELINRIGELAEQVSADETELADTLETRASNRRIALGGVFAWLFGGLAAFGEPSQAQYQVVALFLAGLVMIAGSSIRVERANRSSRLAQEGISQGKGAIARLQARLWLTLWGEPPHWRSVAGPARDGVGERIQS